MEVGREQGLKTGKNPDAILVDLFSAMSSMKNANEASLFLSELMSPRELVFLARRLRIAILLASGFSYAVITRCMGAAPQTIARVNAWFDRQNEGYRLVIRRMGDVGRVRQIVGATLNTNSTDREADNLRRAPGKYEEAFWPVEVIGAITKGIVSAAKKK